MGQRLQISPEVLADALHIEGINDEEIATLLAISRGESTYYFNAVNQDTESGDDSWGLFQINFRKPAAGKDRAKKLGIPISVAFDGQEDLPSEEDLAEYFLLEIDEENPVKENGKKNWVVQDGVTENQLIKRNLDALAVMWTDLKSKRNGSRPFSPWSVHPDSDAYRKATKDGFKDHIKNWERNSKFVNGKFLDEYDEWAYDYQALGTDLVESEPMDSWNRGRNSPTDNDLKQVGPSEREVQLENEWIKNKGNEFRQREIINEILQERNREGYPNPPENSVSGAEQIAIDQGLLEEGATDIGDPLPNLQPGYTEDYEFLRGVPEGEVEFAGQTWNIVDLLEAERDRELGDLVDPSFYFESTDPKYLLWVQGLYEQTQHFFQSAENQALRENNWFKSGDNDEFNPRQLSLLETTITNVEKIFNEAGIVATETELLKFARDAWIQGWSTDAIKDELSNREDMEFGTDAPTASLINASRQDIQSKYRQYLQPIDPEIIAEQNRKLWRGETDLNTIEAGLASDAADVYTAWADRIEAGRTPLQILNSFDPIFRSVMGYTPEWDGNHQTIAMQLGTGAVTGAGLASYLRSTDEYDLTPNAINNAYSLIGTIGETMGVMP